MDNRYAVTYAEKDSAGNLIEYPDGKIVKDYWICCPACYQEGSVWVNGNILKCNNKECRVEDFRRDGIE